MGDNDQRKTWLGYRSPSSAPPRLQGQAMPASQGQAMPAPQGQAMPASQGQAMPASQGQAMPALQGSPHGAGGERLPPPGRLPTGAQREMPFEIDVHYEVGGPASLEQAWVAVEVWTLNRLYSVDAAFVCRAVADRASGRWLETHEIVGETLIGGQRRGPNGAIVRVSHPLPTPGDSAVFVQELGKRLKYSETSEVVRVLFRQRVLDVQPGESPSWDSLAQRRWSH